MRGNRPPQGTISAVPGRGQNRNRVKANATPGNVYSGRHPRQLATVDVVSVVGAVFNVPWAYSCTSDVDASSAGTP